MCETDTPFVLGVPFSARETLHSADCFLLIGDASTACAALQASGLCTQIIQHLLHAEEVISNNCFSWLSIVTDAL